jgi:hypothetical protein
MAKVGLLGAGRHNQIIELGASLIGDDLLSLEVDMGNSTQHDPGVLLGAQDTAGRRGNVGGRESGSRHLVEQRVKKMIIVLVDNDNLEGRTPQRFGRGKPSKT